MNRKTMPSWFFTGVGGLLLLATPVTVQGQFNYFTTNGTIAITGYTGPGGAVNIPAQINGLPVTSIDDYAFGEKTNITSVTIPDSVTSIADYAFSYCSSLTSVMIGNSVTNIGDEAFFDCALTSVTIPNSVTSLGSSFEGCNSLTNVIVGTGLTYIEAGAFSQCSNLIAIAVAAQNPVYSSLNGVLFDKNQSQLLLFPPGFEGGYTIPDSVTNIGSEAFFGCALTSVTIPDSITRIGDFAFEGCDLTSVTIRSSVSNIDYGAFAGCGNLKSVFFQGNAPTVYFNAFYSLTEGFYGYDPTTVYYLPGTLGWSTSLAGRPTALWFLPQPLILNQGPGFGVQSNQFGFTISWATNAAVVVEATTNLSNPVWVPLSTNTLTSGTSYFSDATWTNYLSRLYRLTTP